MSKIILSSVLFSVTLALGGCGGSSGGSSGSGGGNNNTQPGGNNTPTNPIDTSALQLKTQPVRGGVIVGFEPVAAASSYVVYTSNTSIDANSPSAGGSSSATCAQSPCLVTGLENGKRLNLRLAAVSASNQQLAISSQQAVVAGAINDTGEASCISITTGSFPNGISSCDDLPAVAAIWPNKVAGVIDLPSGRVAQQDGNTGRDADAQLLKIGSGEAGFDYTKLDSSGNAVAANAINHECFRDNVTGLVWQASAGDSLVDYDATSGSAEPASLCGISTGWRLPTKAEAESQLHYSRAGVSVDTSLFAAAPTNNWYWTRSPYPAALSGPDAGTGVQNDSTGSNFHNWVINFTTGQRSTFDTSGVTAQSQARTMYVNSTANP